MDSHDVSATREDIIDESIVDVLLAVLASIRKDDNTIIVIEAFADGGEDDTSGGNTSEDDGIDIVGREDATKASVGEHAETSFGQNGVVWLNVKRRVELSSIGSDNHAVVALDLREDLSKTNEVKVRNTAVKFFLRDTPGRAACSLPARSYRFFSLKRDVPCS